MDTIFIEMLEKWPSAIVARVEAEKFSGGLIGERYLANLDSAGQGPEGRFRCGRKICYPAKSLALWLEKRTEVIADRKRGAER